MTSKKNSLASMFEQNMANQSNVQTEAPPRRATKKLQAPSIFGQQLLEQPQFTPLKKPAPKAAVAATSQPAAKPAPTMTVAPKPTTSMAQAPSMLQKMQSDTTVEDPNRKPTTSMVQAPSMLQKMQSDTTVEAPDDAPVTKVPSKAPPAKLGAKFAAAPTTAPPTTTAPPARKKLAMFQPKERTPSPTQKPVARASNLQRQTTATYSKQKDESVVPNPESPKQKKIPTTTPAAQTTTTTNQQAKNAANLRNRLGGGAFKPKERTPSPSEEREQKPSAIGQKKLTKNSIFDGDDEEEEKKPAQSKPVKKKLQMPTFSNIDEDEDEPVAVAKKPVPKKEAKEPDNDRAAFLARLNAMHAAGPRKMAPPQPRMASQAQTTNDIMDAKLSVPKMAYKRRTTTKYKAESYQEFADF